ncbi:MAG TPA: UDP-N-acetylmuramoyl-L-alanyl-D-glutamate--2,6-diaminopimelate ligase, partial [Rikenellaceae bacterium]|nr:UDP-N-acetylmuramoyl-L-alanyl-D-glutamate--2,6-diaminopimelate ligase [Rikenellaceae bacterium]
MNCREFTRITADSRKVIPGTLFVAVKGYASDGHDYIADAIAKGATGIVCETLPEGLEGKAQFEVVENSRRALAILADEYYGHPSRKLKLVGITGTNGKTTTVTLLYNLFRSMGHKCGLLSTIANYVGDERYETENTTVDPITLNELLSRMVEEGCEYCFM